MATAQAVWVLYLDLYILDADGSLLDACLLAAAAALRDVRLPAVQLTEDGNVERTGGALGRARRPGQGGCCVWGRQRRPPVRCFWTVA